MKGTKELIFFLFSLCFGFIYGQEVIKDYDGNTYPVKQFGEQVWMMENLKSIHDSKGRKIKRVCYRQVQRNCDKYGGLYAWEDLRVNEDKNMDSLQGICPDGWHIPTDNEWTILIENLGGLDSAAYFTLKDTTLFNLQYAGNFHYRLGNYNYQGKIAYYWTAKPYSRTAAWMRMFGQKNLNVNRSTIPNVYCISVRCVKD